MNPYLYANANPLRFVDPYGLAYFAKRALAAPIISFFSPSWNPGSNNPGSFDDRHNTEASHEHLFFEDDKSPPNAGFGPAGLFIEVSDDGYIKTDGGYNDCVMRIAVDRTPVGKFCALGIGGPKNNCQDWSDRVRRKYDELKNDPLIAKACGLCP